MSVSGLRSPARSSVRPLIRPPFIGVRDFEDGIHYDASINPELGGFMSVKAPNQAAQVGHLKDFFTFTGDANSKYRYRNGLLVSSVSNIPRVEFDANGNVLGLLMEGSRQNICLQSEDFNTTWSVAGGGTSVSTNATTGPDGALTADRLTDDGLNAQHFILQNITLTAATYTWSMFVKSNGQRWVTLYPQGTGVAANAVFDLTLGTVTFTSLAQYISSSITPYANGWYRISITYTGTANSIAHVLYFTNVNNVAAPTYVGTSVGAYLYGSQVELGASPSSYIPTTVAAVTRAADAAQRIFGAEFSQTAGTVFCLMDVTQRPVASEAMFFAASDNTNNNVIWLDADNSANSPQTTVWVAGVLQANLNSMQTTALNTPFRYATAWAANDFLAKSSVNATTQTDVAGTLPTVDRLNIGSAHAAQSPMNGHIFELHYYPSRKPTPTIQAYAA